MDNQPRRLIGPRPTFCAGCLALLLLLLAAYALVQSNARRYTSRTALPKGHLFEAICIRTAARSGMEEGEWRQRIGEHVRLVRLERVPAYKPSFADLARA